jgi:hypothetical protein
MADPQATQPAAPTKSDYDKQIATSKKTVKTNDPAMINSPPMEFIISNNVIGTKTFTVDFNTDKPIDLPKYVEDYLGDIMTMIPVYLKEDGSVGDPTKPADDVRLAFKYGKAFTIA